jgi:hypothetical protein
MRNYVTLLLILLSSCQDRYLRSCAVNILSLGPVEYTVRCPPHGDALPE